jgi:hypothetical protein
MLQPHQEPHGGEGNSVQHGVDKHTGFVTTQEPLQRLPDPWEIWEETLQAARSLKLKTAKQTSVLDQQQKEAEADKAKGWRRTVEEVYMHNFLGDVYLTFTRCQSWIPTILGVARGRLDEPIMSSCLLFSSMHILCLWPTPLPYLDLSAFLSFKSLQNFSMRLLSPISIMLLITGLISNRVVS